MENLTQLVKDLNTLVAQFQFDEALTKFYDEDIISVENENPPTLGLKAYRESGKKFIESISNRSAQLKNVIVSDNLSVCEWHYKFDHKEWGKWDCLQLSVQRWKNGKIIHERHHYNR